MLDLSPVALRDSLLHSSGSIFNEDATAADLRALAGALAVAFRAGASLPSSVAWRVGHRALWGRGTVAITIRQNYYFAAGELAKIAALLPPDAEIVPLTAADLDDGDDTNDAGSYNGPGGEWRDFFGIGFHWRY